MELHNNPLGVSSGSLMDLTEAATQNEDKKKRPRVKRACVACQRAHISCEEVRPCKRCAERGLQCEDYVPKRRGRKRQQTSPSSSTTNVGSLPLALVNSSPSSPNGSENTSSEAQLIEPVTPSIQVSKETLTNVLDLPPDLFTELFFSDWNEPPVTPGATFIPPTTENNNTSNGTPIADSEEVCVFNPKADEGFKLFMQTIRTRVTEDSVDIVTTVLKQSRIRLKEHIYSNYGFLKGQDPCAFFRQEIQIYLQELRPLYAQLAVPTIMWERTGVIQYVNPAYIALTHFNLQLPTPREDFSMFYQMSRAGVKNYIMNFSKVIVDPSNNPNNNSFMVPCGLKSNASQAEIFIDGTLCVTLRRDPVGLPLLIIGCFLPRLDK